VLYKTFLDYLQALAKIEMVTILRNPKGVTPAWIAGVTSYLEECHFG
jgi:hypothetical protein